jgi:hypothetical protein
MFCDPEEHSLVQAGTTASGKRDTEDSRAADVQLQKRSRLTDAIVAAPGVADLLIVIPSSKENVDNTTSNSEAQAVPCQHTDEHAATTETHMEAEDSEGDLIMSSDDEDPTTLEAKHCAVLDLEELKLIGEKVILPDAKRRRLQPAAVPPPAPAVTLGETDAVDWSTFSTDQLDDWVTLEELGGTAAWPTGVTRKSAAAELRRRDALGKLVASQDAPT